MYLIYPFHKIEQENINYKIANNIMAQNLIIQNKFNMISELDLSKIYGQEAVNITLVLFNNANAENALIGWKMVNKIWNFLIENIKNNKDITTQINIMEILTGSYKMEKNHKQINYFDYYFIWFIQCLAKNKLYLCFSAIMHIIKYSKHNKLELDNLQKKKFIAMVHIFCPFMIEYFLVE